MSSEPRHPRPGGIRPQDAWKPIEDPPSTGKLLQGALVSQVAKCLSDIVDAGDEASKNVARALLKEVTAIQLGAMSDWAGNHEVPTPKEPERVLVERPTLPKGPVFLTLANLLFLLFGAAGGFLLAWFL